MKKRVCAVIAQHAWELSGSPFFDDSDDNARLDAQLRALHTQHGIDYFIVAMERGLALDLADAILTLRNTLPIRLECLIPYEEQHIAWPEPERERYFSLIARCDREHMVQRNFTLDCHQQSLRYMLGCCDHFLVLWDGRPSHAGDAVSVIRSKQIPLLVLAPKAKA